MGVYYFTVLWLRMAGDNLRMLRDHYLMSSVSVLCVHNAEVVMVTTPRSGEIQHASVSE